MVGFCLPRWKQHRRNIGAKTVSAVFFVGSLFASMFHGFCIKKRRPRTSKIVVSPQELQSPQQFRLFHLEAVFATRLVPTWSDLGSIFEPPVGASPNRKAPEGRTANQQQSKSKNSNMLPKSFSLGMGKGSAQKKGNSGNTGTQG